MTKKDKMELADRINNKYRQSLDFQRPLFNNFNEYYQIYRGIREEGNHSYAGRAKLFIPYVFSTIETIIPRLIGEKPKIEAIPREASDLDNAKMNTQLFNYQWDTMGMKEKTKLWVKQALIYGKGIVKLTWRLDKKSDGPKTELVDLFDFYIDPNATTVKDADYVIHRLERTLEELKANKNYDIPRNLEQKVQKDEYKLQRDAILGLVKPNDTKKIQVLEFWGREDLGDGEEECLITVADNEVIRAQKNPYDHQEKPFIELDDTQIPHSFWSVGEVEQLKSLQYELNDIRNQRMDNVTMILNRMWLVDKNAGVDENDLVSQAGQIIHTDNMKGVVPVDTPDVTTSAYNEETLVKGDMQMVSGVTDYSRGQGNASVKGQAGLGNNTATGIMLLQEAGNARFKYKLDNIEDALIRFGKQLLALNQQFLDKEMTVRIVGPTGVKWMQLDSESIDGEFDVTVAAGSTQPMNKSVRRAEARELLSALLPLGPIAAQIGVDFKYFIKYLLETYDLTNIDEAFQQMEMPGGLPPAGGQNYNGVPSQINIPGVATVGGMESPRPSSNSQNTLAGATINV